MNPTKIVSIKDQAAASIAAKDAEIVVERRRKDVEMEAMKIIKLN